VRAIDEDGADGNPDTLYVDAIWVDSMVSAVSTDMTVHWDLSSDDGAGEDDIVSYDIYRADEEDGDDIAGPYVYVGSSPAGATTYADVGEGSDLVNQAWYYVEANDGSQTNGSGFFSKLNFPPVAQNLLTNGMVGLVISPFTPSFTLTADANDTSNQYEAIPKMFMAEYFINVDPGEGLGFPIVPVDAVWDTYIEALTGTVDSSTWTPGTYTIGVRVAEDDGGATVWGPVSFISVDVVDGPPIANAGPDQTVAQHTLVTFDGSNSVDDVGITNYWWNFTDGGPQSLTGVGPAYTFDFEGIYTVTLTVMDTIGQTNADIMLVNVTDGDPPVADAGPDQQVTPGDIVTFDGTASFDPGHLGEPIIDGIANWTWTFDDGTGPKTEWGPNPTHQFNIPGIYTVTLMVTDNAPPVTGGPYTDTDTMDVTVVQIFDIDISPAAGSGDWILVSFPNQVSGDPLVIVQDAIDAGGGFVTWDIIQTYNATTGEWLTTSTFKPANLNNFNFVDNFHAFWIHITNYGDNLLTITGALAAPGEQATVPLKAGWNLVGYPFGTTQEMFNTFGTLFSLDRDIEVYDQVDPYRLRIADVWSEWHDPGRGYWVHVAFDEDMVIWAP
jgi:PKD repeat protein